jgi:hypothetical protein
MRKRNGISLYLLVIALLAGLLVSAPAPPTQAVQSTPAATLTQAGQAGSTPYPLQTASATATPEDFDDRPVERNPFLIAGGVLIFLVILFGVLRYSRPPTAEG